MESDQKHKLILEKRAQSTPEKAFEAFTQSEHLSRWFTTNAAVDLRVGGQYSNADGDKGTYLVIQKPNRISFTWDNEKHCPGTIIDLRFTSEDNGVRISLEHSGLKSESDFEDMKGGWSWALDSLKSYLETGQPISYEAWLKTQDKKL